MPFELVLLPLNYRQLDYLLSLALDSRYMCHGFVSAGDALGRECPATSMSSFLAGRSGCK